MSWTQYLKSPKTALTASTVAILGGIIATVSASTDPVSANLILTSLFSALGGLGANFFQPAVQENFLDKTSREEQLNNGDLVRAVGRAIFLLFLHESKDESYGGDCERLETIGNSDESVWENIILGIEEKENPRFKLTEENLQKLMPDFLTHYVAAENGKFDEIESLSITEWHKIVEKLAENHGLLLEGKTIYLLARKLHKQFAKYLHKAVVSQFDEGGKAFVSFQLRISGTILSNIRKIDKTNKQILTKIDELIERNDQIEALYSSRIFPFDNEFCKQTFNLQKNIQEIAFETLTRVKEIGQDVTEIKKDVKKLLENSAEQTKKTTLPKYIAFNSFPSHTNYFTGRGEVIEGIREELEKHNKATLHGISGLGKTSVALEFAKRFEDSYKHIIFLRATDGNEVGEFAKLAEMMDESAKSLEKDADKAVWFKNWLAENDGWLLLIDNVDKPNQVKPFLPVNLRGHCLSTGNSDEITDLGNEVEIKKMTSIKGEMLLYRRAKTLSGIDDEEIKQLLQNETEAEQIAVRNIVKEFDGLPLALNLAGAYIHKFKKTFARYENLYQTSAHKLLEIQDVNDQYQNNSVALAFSLAYEAIEKPENESSEAKQIAETAVLFLKTASFLNPEAIPLEIFGGILYQQGQLSDELLQDEFFYDQVFAKIAQFDLFEKDVDKNTVNIHRLVSKIISNKSNLEEKKSLIEQIGQTINLKFPLSDFTNWEICNKYFRQAIYFTEQYVGFYEEKEIIAVIYFKIAAHYFGIGKFELAEKFFILSVHCYNQMNTPSQEMIISCNNYLGVTYRRMGRYEEAKSKFIEVLELLKLSFDENSKEILGCKNNLAVVYRHLEKYDEASVLFEDIIETFYKTNKGLDSEFAAALNNLAVVYEKIGEYEKAKEKYDESIKILIQLQGKEHINTLSSYVNRAEIYRLLKKYSLAEIELNKVIKIQERVLGKFHPETCRAYNNIATVYLDKKKFQLAYQFLQKAYKGFKETLGEEHPYTINAKKGIDSTQLLLKLLRL